ncbi:MAG: hypothetical protein Q7S44_01910 [bacterium]|nr:hypothetical protein [bacterium]
MSAEKLLQTQPEKKALVERSLLILGGGTLALASGVLLFKYKAILAGLLGIGAGTWFFRKGQKGK